MRTTTIQREAISQLLRSTANRMIERLLTLQVALDCTNKVCTEIQTRTREPARKLGPGMHPLLCTHQKMRTTDVDMLAPQESPLFPQLAPRTYQVQADMERPILTHTIYHPQSVGNMFHQIHLMGRLVRTRMEALMRLSMGHTQTKAGKQIKARTSHKGNHRKNIARLNLTTTARNVMTYMIALAEIVTA